MRKSLFNLRGLLFLIIFLKFHINKMDAKIITEKESSVLLFVNILGGSKYEIHFLVAGHRLLAS